VLRTAAHFVQRERLAAARRRGRRERSRWLPD
jgi:hypothetical protein